MPFAPDYFTARDRFRAAAARLGWATAAFPIDARGPAGEELTIDAAVSPERHPVHDAGFRAHNVSERGWLAILDDFRTALPRVTWPEDVAKVLSSM